MSVFGWWEKLEQTIVCMNRYKGASRVLGNRSETPMHSSRSLIDSHLHYNDVVSIGTPANVSFGSTKTLTTP